MSVQIVTMVFGQPNVGTVIKATAAAPGKWCDKYVLEVPIQGDDLHGRAAAAFVARQFASMLRLLGAWTVVAGEGAGGWIFTCGPRPEHAFTVAGGGGS